MASVFQGQYPADDRGSVSKFGRQDSAETARRYPRRQRQPGAPPAGPHRRCVLGKVSVRYAHIEDLDAPTIYALLRLRQEVFIVEWGSSHLDIDGRDTEPASVHPWAERDGDVLAAVRVVQETDDT